MEFKPCAVIPIFRHADAVRPVIQKLLAQNLPIILVDDGNSAEELQRLFTQLGKEGITQKQEKALMKAIKDALIKMKKLDLVKQRFLAIHIERVLKQRNYESKKYLSFKNC